MNKLFTKIAALALGAAMVVGVGVSIGSKSVSKADAATGSVNVSLADVASENNWKTSAGTTTYPYTSFDLNEYIGVSTNSKTSNGSYFSDGWRLYQSYSGTLVFTPKNGATITSLTITFGRSNSGIISAQNSGTTAYFSSGTKKSVSISSATTYYIRRTGSGTNGQIKITNIAAEYSYTSSDTLESINIASTSKGTTALENATLKTGKTLQTYLTANYSTAGATDKTNDATWTAENGSGSVTVVKGLITGTSVGTATVKASYGGLDPVSLSLEVTQGPGVSLSVVQVTPFHEKETRNNITISTNGFSGTPTITASSSSANVSASILGNGNLQIVGGNSISANETVDVTVTANDGTDSASAVCKVYLKAPIFTLSGTEVNIKPGASSTITVTTDYFLNDVSITAPSGSPSIFSSTVSDSTITITGLAEGNGSITVTATDGTITRTGTISVAIADVLEYSLVTDDSKLVEGSKLLLVNSTNNYAMSAQSGSYRTAASVTISNNIISGPSSDVEVVTLEGGEGAWYLKVSDGYLSWGSGNSIATVTKDEADTWTISIDSNNNATIRPESGRLISFNNSASPKRFACYTSTQTNGSVQIFGILAADKKVVDTKLTTTDGSITASVGANKWTVSGFVFEVQYEGESSWNTVDPTYVVSESVPTSYSSIGDYQVHFKVTFKDTDYYQNTPFIATVTDDMTPISSFYDGTITVGTSATSSAYTYRGTVIAIEGNTYYIQDGSYGIMVYGGSTTYPSGMKIGDLVAVTSKIINYNGYVVESNSITAVDGKTCKILGDGTLPTAPIVTTASDFNSANQSTRITFNGLSRTDEGTSITWKLAWSQGNSGSNGIAKVQDSSGNIMWLYVSKYLDSDTGTAIVNKINTITTDDTFDLFQGVKAINTTNYASSIGGTAGVDYPAQGTAYLSVMSADNITIHTPEEDHVQTWIDQYMQMNNPDFDGDGTGACRDSNYYVNAKAALNALETEHAGSKASFQSESKYADALERYLKWAKACGDSNPFVGSTIQQSIVNSLLPISDSNSTTVITIIVSVIGVSALGGFFFLRKRKEI
ncbi:MAG: hypothetical protein SPL75_02775 [Bacilli bacterium]|nr:hypothetical protein [Bacilli bacterium]